MATQHGFPLDRAPLDEAERAFVTPEACGSVLLPSMGQVVRALHGKLPLAVASNTRSHVLIVSVMLALGLSDAFDLIVTSTDCGWRKPSPRIFQVALDRWKVPPEHLVMIGDSSTKDVAGAKAVGMRAIWLRTDSKASEAPGADAMAEMPLDILSVLGSWGLPL